MTEKLRMSGICKSFPGVRALNDVTLSAHEGEIVGLVGVNGAGKSTLMNILGGVLQPDGGTLEINGKSVSLESPTDADRAGIAFIHQELLYFATQTVAENIFMSHLPGYAQLPWFISRRTATERAEALLHSLGSFISPTTRMESLSVGEKQIVEIARALATGADIVIFDEPTSSLSFKEKEILFDVIQKLKADGATVIYISHFLAEILDNCDSYVVLRNGETAGQGRIGGTTKNDLIRMIVGKDVQQRPTIRSGAHPLRPSLVVKNLCRGSILNNIQFTINHGEILGIWGLMGSGRTELIRAVTGLDPVDSVDIQIIEDGKSFRCEPDQLLKRCAYLTENRRADGLFIDKSVWMNTTVATLGRYISGFFGWLNTNREVETAQEFVTTLGIKTPGVDARVENLSGGNQQKVILAKWLNKRPKILLLDEPTRGVDVGAKQEIADLVTGLAHEGTATLLVSSEVEEMVALCDRVLILREGSIANELTGDKINESMMMSLALGEDRREGYGISHG